MEKSKSITVEYPVSSVYRYLTNIKNYAHHFGSACKVEPSGLAATIEAPLVGQTRTVILERTLDTQVVMSAKKIGTVLTVDLEELSDSKTSIKLSITVDPNIGFIKYNLIKSYAPKALDRVINELMITDFEK